MPHKQIRAEEFYFVLVGPDQLRQVFNDTDAEVLWLIISGPEELEFLQGSKSKMDLSLIYPVDPTQLPRNSPVWTGQRSHKPSRPENRFRLATLDRSRSCP
jgi:hypothetical protein